jgi:hypothetical protein
MPKAEILLNGALGLRRFANSGLKGQLNSLSLPRALKILCGGAALGWHKLAFRPE